MRRQRLGPTQIQVGLWTNRECVSCCTGRPSLSGFGAMYGPKENGFWSRAGSTSDQLVMGATYEVTQAFVDFDGDNHPVGERWRFVGASYLPYDNGLSLFVQTTEGEWHIRMQLIAEEQGDIWGAFEEYVRPVVEVD